MSRRLQLHTMLVGLLGSRNVYFQPPETVKMEYPAIIYSRDSAKTIFANNDPWFTTRRYKITVVDKNPDSSIPGKIAKLRLCTFSTHYTADNLNHDVYNLYF